MAKRIAVPLTPKQADMLRALLYTQAKVCDCDTARVWAAIVRKIEMARADRGAG